MKIRVTEAELKELKLIKGYFGYNDKTPMEHANYEILSNFIKRIEYTKMTRPPASY